METTNEPAVELSGNIKSPRFRSVAYPSSTIQHCIDLTSRINKIFGNLSYTDRIALSKRLEISDSHLQTQLSSCVQYDLLELKPGEGYKPTELFRKAYKPLPTENQLDALRECLGKPELYKAIIKQYDGQTLPMQAGLATILYRNHKVSENASESAAKIFIENAKAAGVLKEDNSFNLGSPINDDYLDFQEQIIKTNENKVVLLPASNQPTGNHTKNPLEAKIPILLDDGKTLEVPLPNGINKPDIERVIKILTAYL